MNKKINDSVFASFPYIETERLLLREFTYKDASNFFQIRGDEKTMAYMDTRVHQTIDESKIMIGEILLSFQEGTGIHWVIESKLSGKMLGYISYWRLMPDHVRAELGYALNRQYWGKGFMKEAALEVIDFGFNRLKVHSIEANVNPGNKASLHLLKSLGFKQEAHLKENFLVNDEFVDTIICSLLEQDFFSR